MAYLHVHQGMIAPQLGLTQIPRALPGSAYKLNESFNLDRIFTTLRQEEELHTT